MDVKEAYTRLTNDKQNAPKILTVFFCDLFSVPFSPDRLIMFSKLVKLYGADIVFNAIIDLYGSTSLDPNGNLFSLFNYICKNYLFRKDNIPNDIFKRVIDAKNKKQKPKHIGDSFEQ